MKIIYYCYTGRLLSMLAGYYHLEQLDEVRQMCEGEGWLNSSWNEDIGPIFLGEDSQGNQVYSLGVAFEEKLITKALEQLWQSFGIGRSNYHFVSVIPDDKQVKLSAYLQGLPIGGYLRRALYQWTLKGQLEFVKTRVQQVKTTLG